VTETSESVKDSSPIVGRNSYFTCDVCCRRFASAKSLVKHLKCKHKTEPLPGNNVQWINSIAPSAGTDSGSRSKDKPKKVQFICPTCGNQFRRRYQLDEHLVTHTHETSESVKESPLFVGGSSYSTCDLCCCRFASTKSLVKHLKCKHKIEPLPGNDVERINSIAPPAVTDGGSRNKEKPKKLQVICPTCGRHFRYRCQLDEHLVTHTGARPAACRFPGCNRRFGRTSTRNYHERTHSDMRPYICSQCGQAFKHSTILRTHVALMHGNGARPHQCSQCGKTFKRKSDLHSHCTTVHMDKRPHSCTECSKRFHYPSQLAKHVRVLHSHERPSQFICPTCGHQFRNRYQLDSHLVTHTGARPAACRFPGCNRRFGQTSTRNYHERTHSDMRPYVCSQCGRAFKHSTILRTHVATMHGNGATPHQCTQCGKAFKLKGALHTHYSMAHTDKRPHSCTECSKRFQYQSQLARHMQALHSHEQPRC